MQEQAFVIKGVKDGLLITLSPTEQWGAMTAELASHIDERGAFFAGARIIIDVGERPVPKYELSSLKALLERRDLTLWAVLSQSNTTKDAANALDLRTSVGSIVRAPVDADTQVNPEENGVAGVLI